MSRPVLLHNTLLPVEKRTRVDFFVKFIIILESFFGVDRLQLSDVGRCIRFLIRLIATAIVLNTIFISFEASKFNFHITIVIVLVSQTTEYFGCILFALTSRKSVNQFFNEINIFDRIICKKCSVKTNKEKLAFIVLFVSFNTITTSTFIVLLQKDQIYVYAAQQIMCSTVLHNIELFLYSYLVTMVYHRIHVLNIHWENELSHNCDDELINEKMENIMIYYRILSNAMLHLKNGIKWQLAMMIASGFVTSPIYSYSITKYVMDRPVSINNIKIIIIGQNYV